MPLYAITLPAGLLDAAAKCALANSITGLHCKMAGVPRHWVHIVFHEYAEGCAFTGGEPMVTVGLTVIIRSGRSADYKKAMLEGLEGLLKTASRASDEEIVVGILEVPAGQAMEMGKVMDDV